jgi:hypothetical protein
MQSLRQWKEEHIEEDCSEMTGTHEDGLFFGCRFHKLNDLTLKDCDLNRSEFTTDDVRDALGFTLTLNCHSFSNVKYSPLLFDLLLMMMISTRGNDAKRLKLVEVIGKERFNQLSKILKVLE